MPQVAAAVRGPAAGVGSPDALASDAWNAESKWIRSMLLPPANRRET
jgi:hypothetical protein